MECKAAICHSSSLVVFQTGCIVLYDGYFVRKLCDQGHLRSDIEMESKAYRTSPITML